MKRRASQGRWGRKMVLILMLCFCIGSLVMLQKQYIRVLDLETASPPDNQKPRIAFLFIARNRLPLDMVWDAFFRGEKEGRFLIYVHSRPGFVLNRVTTSSLYFHGRQVNNSIQVDWGESSMLEAERILLRNALMDPFNERFVFLSDRLDLQSCIPLYNFSYTYDYIMSTPTSFIDSFADTKEGRYNPRMNPIIPVYNWRKGSQRRSLPEFWRDHPIQKGFEGEITRRSLTHTSWDLSSSRDRQRRGWHPVTYKLSDATPSLIKSIKDIDNIYYETEYRREWCTSRGRPSTCFLFARKFTRSAALRLLNMSILAI
ncbi:glycosyltransferase BC10 isoform X6 [Typha angustifolia]|uniref:glycosyltransferase BC10 isoform X6 n=1 Tax=Typha angustifolia TaxID=59011 RepID=UPI003C2EF1D0